MKQATLKVMPFALMMITLLSNIAWADDPLPSWNDGTAKKAVVEFVAKMTTENSRATYTLNNNVVGMTGLYENVARVQAQFAW